MPLIKLRQIEGGGAGGGVGLPLVPATPTRIPVGATFTVPEDCQVLYKLPITVEGALVVHGALVAV